MPADALTNGAPAGPVETAGPAWGGPAEALDRPAESWDVLEISRARTRVPGEIGVWIFIFGEMCLYGLLFICLISARGDHPGLFDSSAGTLDTTIGVINTLLLLTASVCVALGIRSVREGITTRGPVLFSLAFVCGLGFVFDKYLEYSHLISIHLTPAKNAFYTWYYVLTGIHLTHVLAGLCVLAFLYRVSRKPQLEPKDVRAMESGASWWHLVDLLWVVLFPLLYLVH